MTASHQMHKPHITYRGKAMSHDDMSEYVVHFTKAPPPPKPLRQRSVGKGLSRTEFLRELAHFRQADRTGYFPMMDILGSGAIKARKPFGAAKNVAGLGDSQYAVCLSEVPFGQWKRLTAKRSLYGIGFHQSVIKKKGARVWYVDKDSRQERAVKKAVAQGIANLKKTDPIWKLTPFIDFPGRYFHANYQYEWEREWRVVGDLDFEPTDVAFLLLPARLHHRALQFFVDAEFGQTGPGYFCPYVDPRWTRKQVDRRFQHQLTRPEPSPNARPWWE